MAHDHAVETEPAAPVSAAREHSGDPAAQPLAHNSERGGVSGSARTAWWWRYVLTGELEETGQKMRGAERTVELS